MDFGYDIRILQLEGAKDPDEFIIKYGSGRFNTYVDKAISLVEFKVKMLKKDLDLENTNDKIKFLTEVSKILSGVTNQIEMEVYLDKICSEYNISKEAIYARINKEKYAGNSSTSTLTKPVIQNKKVTVKKNTGKNQRTENLIISLLISSKADGYEKLKSKISPNDFKDEKNKKIISILYKEFEKGNSNINNILDEIEDEDLINHITYIMAEDFEEYLDKDKAIGDIINTYEKERLVAEKAEILNKLSDKSLSKEESTNLLKRMNQIVKELKT